MLTPLLIVNALLTLPFGLATLAAPALVFAQFGLRLDPAAALVARGYAATLVGYGLAVWSLRRSRDRAITRPLLLSLVAFNGIEAIIQGVAGAEGLALPVIFVTVVIHAVLCGACGYAYRASA